MLFGFCKDLFVDVSIMCVFGCFERKLFHKLMFSTLLWGLVRQDFLCKALAEVSSLTDIHSPLVPSCGLDVLNFTCLFPNKKTMTEVISTSVIHDLITSTSVNVIFQPHQQKLRSLSFPRPVMFFVPRSSSMYPTSR